MRFLRSRDRPTGNEPSIIVGWREWVGLPLLGAASIRAKIDTGARTSALHAHDLTVESTSGKRMAHFTIRPTKGSDDGAVTVEAEVIEERAIRSSNGVDELRPVIMTSLTIGASTWPVEITLTDRELMGFPMLIGRSALRNRCMIDPNRSFCAGVQPSPPPSEPTRKPTTR